MNVMRRRIVLAAPLTGLASYAAALEAPAATVVLTVRGALAQASRDGTADFDMAMLERLPQRSITTETPWHSGARTFQGPLLREVLAAAGAPRGQTARLVALNDYSVKMPLHDALRYDRLENNARANQYGSSDQNYNISQTGTGCSLRHLYIGPCGDVRDFPHLVGKK